MWAQQSVTATVLVYVQLLLNSQNCRPKIIDTILTAAFCTLLLRLCFSFHSWLMLTGAKEVIRYCRIRKKRWTASFPNHWVWLFGLDLVFTTQSYLKGSRMLKWLRFLNTIILVKKYICKCIAHTVCLFGLSQGIINVFRANFFFCRCIMQFFHTSAKYTRLKCQVYI